MKEEVIKRFKGEKVSILLRHPKAEDSRTNESYTGTLLEVSDGVVILEMLNDSHRLKNIIVECDLISSMWIYNNNQWRE